MMPRILDVLPRPVAWVFTSGGGRAAAQVGMAEVLFEQEYQPDLLVGSSFGAINAAALADSQPGHSRLRKVWHDMAELSVFASPGAAAVRGLGPRGNKHVRQFHALLADLFEADDTTPLHPDVTVVASNLADGAPRPLSDGPLVPAVAAACSIPVLLPPAQLGGEYLVDGGLSAATPVRQAARAGAASIVLLDTGTSAVPEQEVLDMRWWQVAALAYNHQIRSQIGYALPAVAQKMPIAVISSDEGSVLDFSDPDEQFQVGRRIAAAALARDLRDQDLAEPGVHGVLARDRQH